MTAPKTPASKVANKALTRRTLDKRTPEQLAAEEAFQDASFKEIPTETPSAQPSSGPIDLTPKGEDGKFDFASETAASQAVAPALAPAVIGTPTNVAPANKVSLDVELLSVRSLEKYQALMVERDRIERQITAVRDESREEAVAKAKALLRSVGLQCTVTHMPGAAPYKISPLLGRPVVKYRHKLTGATWSGRGREPEWMHDRANVIRA